MARDGEVKRKQQEAGRIAEKPFPSFIRAAYFTFK